MSHYFAVDFGYDANGKPKFEQKNSKPGFYTQEFTGRPADVSGQYERFLNFMHNTYGQRFVLLAQSQSELPIGVCLNVTYQML